MTDNGFEIDYQTGTASEEDVYQHLVRCSKDFSPQLESRVDIRAYSKKIVNLGVTFEAWADTKLVGLIAVYFNDESHRQAYVTSVSSAYEYKGLGIATKLLNDCIIYARERCFEQINLEVHFANENAIGLYKKANFHAVGKKGETLTMCRHLAKDL